MLNVLMPSLRRLKPQSPKRSLQSDANSTCHMSFAAPPSEVFTKRNWAFLPIRSVCGAVACRNCRLEFRRKATFVA